MKEKSYQLLKELLLEYTRGAYQVLDTSISIAIDIYCETNSKERETIIKYLREIYSIAWDNYEYNKLEVWQKRQIVWEKLISKTLDT